MREKKRCRWLALLLAVVMVLSVLPTAVFAETGTDSSTFERMFMLDCGRKYFNEAEIKGLIDSLSANHFTHMILAFGNNGLRFLLDDMAVGSYQSDAVKNAVKSGNEAYNSSMGYTTSINELTQAEMTEIIQYAKNKNIEIIPLLNTPGHMTAIVSAMNTLGVSTGASGANMSLSDSAQVSFVKELVGKYAKYFADNGCEYFHIGADEYSFSSLNSSGYASFVGYINDLNALVQSQGIKKSIAFNDGIYYKADDSSFLAEAEKISKDITVAYWTKASNYASSSILADKGFTLLNNNNSWYYVLGDALYHQWSTGQWGYQDSKAQLQAVPCTAVSDGGNVDVAGSVLCVWCDYPSYTYESEKVTDLISTMAAANPSYFASQSGSGEQEEPDRTVTLAVGATTTDTISGANYAGTYTTDDPSIATVEVTGKDATEATTTYTEASVTCNTLLSRNSNSWTAVSGYYYKADDGNYYPVYAKRSSQGRVLPEYTYTWGYSTTSSASNVTQIGDTQRTRYPSYTAPDITVYTQSSTAGTPASTTVTFTGVAVGTTYVTIGGIRYIINVIAEDLSDAADLPIQLWITNGPITVTGVTNQTSGVFNSTNNGQYAQYVTVKADKAYGVDGVALSSLVPAGVKNNDETTLDDLDANYVLWKGTVLNKTTGLQLVWNTNKCNAGADFTYVRYFGGNWAVSADRINWTTVTGAGSTGTYSSCSEQIIAYYMQRTKITDQVTTDMVDSGNILSELDSVSGNYVLLDFAVNANGTLVPDVFPQTGKTLQFHCDGGGDTGLSGQYRRLNALRALETSDYEIYMITITPTADSTSSETFGSTKPTSINYSGTERVIWALSEEDIPENYKTVNDSDYTDNQNYNHLTYGGEPTLSELYIYNLQGMLVTYYVRGKQTEDSLLVKYVDDVTGNTFYTAVFPVTVNAGETKDFNNSLLDAAGNAYVVPANSKLLDNTYYILDPYNAKVYVRSDLTRIPDVHGIYSTGVYQHVKAEIDPTNSKVLLLHYTYEPGETNKDFVLDFGLPVTVKATDVVTNVSDVTSISAKNGAYGTVAVDGTSFIYTPTSVLRTKDVVAITVNFKDDTSSVFKIGFIPASNVLYEDNFLKVATNIGSDYKAWTELTDSAKDAVQSADQKTLYGYDVAYEASTGNSMGSAWTIAGLSSGDGSQYLTTTFTGNGFDLIGTAGPDTGYVYVLLKPKDGSTAKLYVVDTSYVDGSNTTLTQVPLLHAEFDTQRTYDVTIRAAYRKRTEAADSGATGTQMSRAAAFSMSAAPTSLDSVYDMVDAFFADGFEIDDVEYVYFDDASALAELENSSRATYAMSYALNSASAAATADAEVNTTERPEGTTVTIDGFRVYRPTDNSAYEVSEHNEYGATYVNVADAVLNDGTNVVAFTENGSSDWTSVKDYHADGGPKWEVYLDSNLAIAFKVNTTSPVQISARAIDASAVMNVNGDPITLTSKTEMYYEVTPNEDGIVAIQATSGKLAIANIKIPAGTQTTALTDDEITKVVPMLLRMAAAPGEPDPEQPGTEEPAPKPVFTPETFKTKVSSLRTRSRKVVTLTITASTDVDHVVVNGKTYYPMNKLLVKLGWSKTCVFTIVDTAGASETRNFEIVAYNADGLSSITYTDAG